MLDWKLRCPECGYEQAFENVYACPACGYSLESVTQYAGVSTDSVAAMLSSARTVWDFLPLLPVENKENIVSLGEGGTPLVPALRMSAAMGTQLLLKDETRNPTCSFKDRPNTVGISVARELGINTVAIASTGNGGASLAAYAARANMKCYVFIPEATPAGKVVQSAAHGATIVRVKGHYSNPYQLALEASQHFGWANLTSTYLNPFTMEGDKTIAYELHMQTNGVVPDWIVVPLGAGAMLSGIYKGYQELQRFGFVNKLPKMIGVQAAGCAPITRAFEEGREKVDEWQNPKTVAGGICDPLSGYAKDGTRTLRCIRASGGVGITVTDEEIMTTLAELAQQEAIFCEPAAAAAAAAAKALAGRGVIRQGETVVSIITGHGLKDTEIIAEGQVSTGVVSPDLEEFRRVYMNHY